MNLLQRASYPVLFAAGRRCIDRRLTAPPIIIGGCGRSGTTLLLSMLSAHPHLFALPNETNAFLEWDQPAGGGRGRPRLDKLYFHALRNRIPARSRRFCEKTPRNVRHFDRILDYYGGQVVLIHLVRDGRDVVTSQHPTAPGHYWVTVERWVADTECGLAFRDHPRVLTLRYEDLITDHVAELRRICAFAEEPFVPQLESWHEHTRVRRNRAWSGPVKDVYRSSVKRWQRGDHRARLEQFLAHPRAAGLLRQLGYAMEPTRPAPAG